MVHKLARKRIAEKRIKRLFKEAEKRARQERLELSNRYVEIARKISMKYLVRIPKEFRMKYCKKCGSYLVPGKNCRIRLQKHKVVITCLNCGEVKRYPYIREIKERRKI
ncbi:MAG: ribonuclease P [Thermoplasmata archaeon]|nr:MAG: ribonuclease P [Thermoplasmata archaeon]MCD6572757.1 ribonuclease P [Thermoplasmata archaeon]